MSSFEGLAQIHEAARPAIFVKRSWDKLQKHSGIGYTWSKYMVMAVVMIVSAGHGVKPPMPNSGLQ
jgi:hypothetical protein